jgi:DNA helicase-2/ATP-dependent DNA helicase PcrA
MITEASIAEKRQLILDAAGHLLVEGGPGSGKTTIALLKAEKIAAAGTLSPYQHLLFLSFARATISRVEEQSRALISVGHRHYLEINTYHGFCWQILKAYGYLLTPHRSLRLITPPNMAARLAGLSRPEAAALKDSLLKEQGLVGFDLFATLASEILENAPKIAQLLAHAYPYIVVDEFQDTDPFEWKIIQLLGQHCTIIALADLDQRIYEFRGASVTRVPEFVRHFSPERVDLGKTNHRSPGTDIAQFGDDLLTGANVKKVYSQVTITRYQFYRDNNSRIHVLTPLGVSITRLRKAKPDGDWSIAILVPRKLDTLNIANFLASRNINHEVMIDPEGPAIAAVIIASLLQPPAAPSAARQELMRLVIHHIKGRKGDKVTLAELQLAHALEQYLETGKVRGKNRELILSEVENIVERRRDLRLTGVPETDWLAVRNLFRSATAEVLQAVYEDARFIKLLHKGALLSARLAEMWRETGSYSKATEAIEDALAQEHFSMANRSYRGIFVMNIHKSKGKEFDEVIIYEEYRHPIVYASTVGQGALLLRVAITRARSHATFLTPGIDPCLLLLPRQ